MKKFPITTLGYEAIKAELIILKEKRSQVSKAIGEAREHGDLKENAEYHAAKDEQRLNEERIANLETQIALAEVIDISKLKDTGQVIFGCTVGLIDLDTEESFEFQIVGEYEANVSKGKLSIASPIARALLRKEVGETVLVETPKGQIEYEITNISLIAN
ncbi:MAG: transcription elongation factor GreA [Gammaproteobacteria bacterium]|nr:transcription elongation factor GreA [Gammaproteobacteria bacterium]